MELDHEFTVPVPVDRAWSVLLDVERVAQCVPGATLESAENGEYTGRLRVKVGAMTVTYRGTARIVAADESARTVTIEASGKEARGPGTASATVQARLHSVPDEGAAGPGGGGTTRVTVHTKLNVTGRPAQFGRNILSEVGAKLIGRFADTLAKELESSEESGAPAAEDIVDQQGAAQKAKEVQEQKNEPRTPTEAPEPTPAEGAAPPQIEPKPIPQQRPPSETRREHPAAGAQPRREQEPIDLLEVAGPSVAKRAVPAIAAVVAVLLAARFLIRRRRRRNRR
ncbi:carbon monoxide dehydrogenase subunit G [Actinomadura sp. NBRC 104425]|uniref:SRPBCC family protein n=1 Tax=Actinomadura sp. NBRC 104425 TaxID=3032204 RepID=UPI0024A5DDF6|nr:carbon monoxide dehydrogenase subunit G [Actinomadura sp. NBRC 104425]